MKKLALALVCFASVAFFASCTEQKGQPTIAVHQEEGYVKDGDVVNLGEEVNFGFTMATAANSKAQLSKLIIKIDDEQPDTIALTGTTYTYRGTIVYQPERDEIVGSSTISATVYDTDGEFATTSLGLSLNQTEEPLAEVDFEWYRLGNTQTGLEEYGLYWDQNAKAPFAQIKPLTGVILYKFESSVWEEVRYETQKAAKFADGATTAAMYNNVDVNLANGTYDDVIGTRMPDGTLHLIHVTSHRVGAQQSAGRPIYINGQAK